MRTLTHTPDRVAPYFLWLCLATVGSQVRACASGNTTSVTRFMLLCQQGSTAITAESRSHT